MSFIKNRHLQSFLSASLSIVPMILIILILHISGISRITSSGSSDNIWLLIIGMFVLIIGMALFQIGASSSLAKVGEYMGASLSKQKNLFIIIVFAFALGLLITAAEPSILIVSKQVTIVKDNPILNMFVLVGGIAVGVGIFVVIGVLRILYHKPIKLWYIFFYCITFMLISLIALDPERRRMLPFIFDAGGVTTGSATVPFILAMGVGVAAVRGGKNAANDSFGLVGLASVGPIISTALLILFQSEVPNYNYPSFVDVPIYKRFFNALLPVGGSTGSLIEVLIALAPILVIFFIYNFIYIKLPKGKIIKLLIGFLYTYVGLTIFLCGTAAAMSPIGGIVGENLASHKDGVIVLVAFAIGLVTILCEPAVHVLTKEIGKMSNGGISKITVLLTLSLGVGVAIGLAALRAVFNFSILYIIVPGYAICLALSFICPDIYTSMAFDSGGTASGPMASSFVLPMIIGIVAKRCLSGSYGDITMSEAGYELGFGVVALIAMTPIIAIQILGIIQKIKTDQAYSVMRKHIYSLDDAQIINF